MLSNATVPLQHGSVCSGDGHTEALLLEFDPSVVSYDTLLDLFMKQHDPCVPMSTQYQSAVWPQTEAGLYSCCIQLTLSLKAPGFNP